MAITAQSTHPLQAYTDPYPHPTLLHKQEFTSYTNQPFLKLVDHAVNLEKDETL